MAGRSSARTRRPRTAVVVLVAVTAALLCGSTAKAAPREFFGLVPNADLKGADYRMIGAANVGAARVSLFWHLIEGRDDRFDWSAADRLIGGLAAEDIRSLPLLFGTPAWLANEPSRPPVGSAKQRREWREFVAAAVRRYGQGGTYWSTEYPLQFPGGEPQPIDTWQVWNEQNGPKHFHPKPSAKKYARLLGTSSKALESEDPGVEIVTGGMASKPTGRGGIKAWKYVRKLLKRRSARESVDHVALHPYARDDRQIASHVKRMRRALKKGGKRRGQVWITELGWSSRPKGGGKLTKNRRQQAKLLRKTYRLLERKRRSWKIGGVYWYTWRDFRGGVCDWCPHAGLVTRGGKPKPSYRKYKRVAR